MKKTNKVVQGNFIKGKFDRARLKNIKEEVEKKKSFIEIIEKMIKVYNYLGEHNTRFYHKIHNINDKTIQSFLFDEKNFSNMHAFLPTDLIPNYTEKLSEFEASLENGYKKEDVASQEYIQNLSNEEIKSYYQLEIKKLNEIKEGTKETLAALEETLTTLAALRNKGLTAPNDLYNNTINSLTKSVRLGELGKTSQEREKALEILKNIDPDGFEKIEDKENSQEIISLIIGIKLSKIESIVYKALRALVEKAFQQEQITNHGSKITAKTSDLYALCNIKPRKGGGYEDKQTRKVKEVLQSGNNLTKDIYYERKNSFFLTRFVHEIYWTNNQTITFQISDTFFVNNKDNNFSYYYQDVQGCNKLLDLMPNSDAAFKLHGYLEYSLRVQFQEFSLTKLLNHSGLIKTYNNKQPTRAIRDLEKILDNMTKANTLIKSWKKAQGKNNIKYILENTRFDTNVVKFGNNNFLVKKNSKKKK